MLGWHISVYRQTDVGAEGTRLAVWQTNIGGLNWLNKLVEAGKASNLGGSGYPLIYSGKAEHIIPFIVEKPLGANDVWTFEADDILTEKWEGTTVIDRAGIRACRLDERLIVKAWDES